MYLVANAYEWLSIIIVVYAHPNSYVHGSYKLSPRTFPHVYVMYVLNYVNPYFWCTCMLSTCVSIFDQWHMLGLTMSSKVIVAESKLPLLPL